MHCLSQLAPDAATETEFLDGSQSLPHDIGSLVVCNRGTGSAVFRVRLALGDEASASSQYLFYDYPINPKDTLRFDFPWGIKTGDVLYVYSDVADLTFALFGETNT